VPVEEAAPKRDDVALSGEAANGLTGFGSCIGPEYGRAFLGVMNDERAEGGGGGDEGSDSLWVNAALDAVRLRLLPELLGVFDPCSEVVSVDITRLGPTAASLTSPPALRSAPEPEPEPEPEPKTG
jgi:hypothetical protein